MDKTTKADIKARSNMNKLYENEYFNIRRINIHFISIFFLKEVEIFSNEIQETISNNEDISDQFKFVRAFINFQKNTKFYFF